MAERVESGTDVGLDRLETPLRDLIVFDNGQFWSTPPGQSDPVLITATDLAGCLSPGEIGPPPPVAPDVEITCRNPMVLVRGEDRMLAWDHTNSAAVSLDAIDVAVLAGSFPTDYRSLSDRHGDAAGRLTSLVAAGLLGADLSPRSTRLPGPLSEESQPPANLRADSSPPVQFLERVRRHLRSDRLRRLVDRVLAKDSRTAPKSSANNKSESSAAVQAAPGHSTSVNDESDGETLGSVRSDRKKDLGSPSDKHPEPRHAMPTSQDSDQAEGRAAPRGNRTRVLASWDIDQWGQPLALGGLLAYARVYEGGGLNALYDMRPVCRHEELLDELRRDDRPAIVLFSDYIWSADQNLATAALVRELGPEHIIIHGGPHVPRYEHELTAHFAANTFIDFVSHGEGEITLAELLAALAGDTGRRDEIRTVRGLTIRDREGQPVGTPERPRHDELADFPSPYLSGEFDHLDSSGWQWPSIETNRGCPYSCTFCDWGSAVNSRVRFFPMERVEAELEWLAARDLRQWMINDANFGIHKRDVDIAKHVVDLREQYGTPVVLYMNYAKNTIKYLKQIIGMLVKAGITGEGALALQTRDPVTLAAIKRSNIKVDKYDELAAEFRSHGLPLVTDLIIGLPGQTIKSLLSDMQYCIDNDVTPRFFPAINLPNAEMNSPEYREKFRLVIGDGDVVTASSSFTAEDRQTMMRLRMAYRSLEHFGILRHVLRYLQWDLKMPASEVLHEIETRVHDSPAEYPLLAWVLGYLDLFLIPPFGWPPFLSEVKGFLNKELGVAPSAELDTVIRVQEAVLPWQDREFPCTVDLDHDYVSWFNDNTNDPGWSTGLDEYGPGHLTIRGDPLFRCHQALTRLADERPHELLASPFWTSLNWEVDSPLERLVTETAIDRAMNRSTTAADQT